MSPAVDLLQVLRRSYERDPRRPAGVFAAEIEAPDSNRRADALWMPTTATGERGIVGHEIKVSRSDVLVELADPTKADAWAKYCTRWWLVVLSPALVEGLDVPDHWGIMSPPSGRSTRSMTVLRPAPKLQPVDEAPAFRRLAVWLHWKHQDSLAAHASTKSYQERQVRGLEQEVERMRSAGDARVSPHAERLGRILRRAEQLASERDWLSGRDVDDEMVAQAIADVAVLQRIAQSARWDLERLVRSAQDLAQPLARTVEDLAKLPPITIGVPAPEQLGATA